MTVKTPSIHPDVYAFNFLLDTASSRSQQMLSTASSRIVSKCCSQPSPDSSPVGCSTRQACMAQWLLPESTPMRARPATLFRLPNAKRRRNKGQKSPTCAVLAVLRILSLSLRVWRTLAGEVVAFYAHSIYILRGRGSPAWWCDW
jgi:hypothetical protein